MNPTQPTQPQPVPEQQPQSSGQPELTGRPSNEKAPVPMPVESAPAPGGSVPATSTPASQPQPLVATPPAPPSPGPASTSAASMSTPAIADDVDVIEKEWVDHATKIIDATKGDPYVEEEAIEDLQVDYLKKRYGKDVKKDQPPAAS